MEIVATLPQVQAIPIEIVEHTPDAPIQVITGSNSVAIWQDGKRLASWSETDWTENPLVVYDMADTIRLALTDPKRFYQLINRHE